MSGHRGTRAIQVMVEYAPSTGGLALWMQHHDVDDRPEVAIIANDGNSVFYGPLFAQRPLEEQVGLVAHQVLHVALRHSQRLEELRRLIGEVDLQLYNICADAIINSSLSHLPWLQLPAGSVFLEALLEEHLHIRESPESSLLQWDVESLYRRFTQRGTTPTPKRGTTPVDKWGRTPFQEDGYLADRLRRSGAGILADLLPAEESEAAEDKADHTREWRERMVRAHAGDGEFSMLRALLADMPRLRTPWEHILRTRVARGLARLPETSWSRPARSWLANQGRTAGGRRLPWEPGRVSARKVPRLALIVDVSGSIDEALLARFATEVEAIVRRTEASLTLIIGDDHVRAVETLELGRRRLEDIVFEGGGGTDFSPLLIEAERHGPDMCLVLTDLQGPADYQPGCPVLWLLSPQFAKTKPPFGETLPLID
ncbi:Predicted metal-dependent peptidase [Ectothiorhodosinus mongolicus]|uniref:Predicted metal-dependent peptidase n=1 Tax=Ectothiorhodosinus mongolicus TaxID=233100 RepID=A0A1R3VMU4_9GAMM|nr:VWA-like domain-containing protein [Ectothiorhodosinus mongolicus]SIT65857.1 Predicted metal-dependent peptidase [Ectothiorhodosinus mongolicus]